MQKAPQKTRSDALEEHEILDALGASGYPLEVRLLRAFSDGGMDPIIGFRIASGPTESREVDIIAQLTRNIPVGAERVLRVTLRLLVEAKAMEPGSAFVGFRGSVRRIMSFALDALDLEGCPRTASFRDSTNRMMPSSVRKGSLKPLMR